MSMDVEVIGNILGVIFTFVGAIIGYYYNSKKERRITAKTSEKIDRLSNLLKSAGSEIQKLEAEVTSKSRRLEELNETSKRLETLVSLKGEQIEAIRQELKSTLKESNRPNRLWTIVIGAMWFVLGLFVRGFLRF
jgi:gas vesicle protein